MDTATTRPRSSPPAPPPKPKNKAQNGSEFHNEHIANNNIENYHLNNNNQQHLKSFTNNNNNYYLSVPPSDEQVVMTPKGKTSNSTVILIERKLVEEVSDRVHVAGGDHQGIIINKDIVKGINFTLNLFYKFFLINFLPQNRSEKCKSSTAFIPWVSSIFSKCKNRATHSGVTYDKILVPRLAAGWRIEGTNCTRFLPWTRESKGVPTRFASKKLIIKKINLIFSHLIRLRWFH